MPRGSIITSSIMTLSCSLLPRLGMGKLLIAIVITMRWCGTMLVEPPLLVLGTDQLTKASYVDKVIEAYHIDQLYGPKATGRRAESDDDSHDP